MPNPCGYKPAPLCVMRMMNDARYTKNEVGNPSADDIEANRHLFSWKNVEFHETGVILNVGDLRRHTIVQVRSLRDIPEEAKLFVNYVPAHEFPKGPDT